MHVTTPTKKRKRAVDAADPYVKLLRRNKAAMRRKAAADGGEDETTTTTPSASRGRPVIVALRELINTKSPLLVYTSAVADAETDYEGAIDRRHRDTEPLPMMLPEPRAKLWPYQEEAVRFIADREADTAAVGCRGLMLCDDMGLGKTLESLTYIYRDIQQRQRTTGRRFNGVTLIVVPAAVIGTWVSEIENSFPPNSLRYVKMTGDSRSDVSLDRLHLETCTDIIFTTYTIVSLVYKSRTTTTTTHKEEDVTVVGGDDAIETDVAEYVQHRYGLLFDMHFVRVVLDEAHYIVNASTTRFRAMSTLKTQSRWMNTGTPIQNSYANIYACFDFIRVRLDTLPALKNGDTPVSQGDEAHIKSVLEKVMIRRLRHQVVLPTTVPFHAGEVDRQVVYVDFETPAERILYLLYADYGLSKMHRGGGGGKPPGYVRGEKDLNITMAIQLMRQCCIDFHIVRRLILPNGMLIGCNGTTLTARRTSFGEKLFYSEASRYEHVERDNGVIEYNAFRMGSGGTFRYRSGGGGDGETRGKRRKYVWRPYLRAEEGADNRFTCELYRAVYELMCQSMSLESITTTIEELVGGADLRAQIAAVYTHLQSRTLPRYATKQMCVVRYIEAIEDASDKIVVLSDSVCFLRRMSTCLADHGIRSCSITGENTRNGDIEGQLSLFRGDASMRVLLLSLKMAVGLNIPCANHMLFCSMWWNPYSESQAECRCQRVGQTKQVHVRYFLIRDTIEEYIHSLSLYKKNIAYNLIESQGGGGGDDDDEDDGTGQHLDEATRKRLFDFQLSWRK